MKKLMIAVAAVSMAVAANAGVYTWGFGSGADIMPGGGDEDYLEGGTAMLFLGTIGQTDNGDGTWSLDFSKATLVGDPAGQDPSSYMFGQIAFDKTYANDAIDNTKSQAYSLILFEDSGVTDYESYEGNYFVASNDSVLKQDPQSEVHYSQFTRSAAVEGGDWRMASAVPEPTSGLLLLLGVAGLALRRRRA